MEFNSGFKGLIN